MRQLLTPDEVWSIIAYLQKVEQALRTDYGPLAQQFNALGLTRLSQKVSTLLQDIHGALNIYLHMYHNAAFTKARIDLL